jgi:hypothetical protein
MQPHAPRSARRRFALALLSALLFTALFTTGCQTISTEVPLGNWSGSGTAVFVSWQDTDDTTPARPMQTDVQKYDTYLRISNDTLDDEPILRVEILSQRDYFAPVPKLDDHTHMIVALQPTQKPSPWVQLYRATDWQFNPKPGDKLSTSSDAPPVTASAIADKDGLTLQIQYLDNFVDTLRFTSAGVQKAGSLFDSKSGLVHWSEHLHAVQQSPLTQDE